MSAEESSEKRGRGRPRKGKVKDIQLKAWIGQDEQDKIDHILIETDLSKSEILRKAIRTYYYTYYGKWGD